MSDRNTELPGESDGAGASTPPASSLPAPLIPVSTNAASNSERTRTTLTQWSGVAALLFMAIGASAWLWYQYRPTLPRPLPILQLDGIGPAQRKAIEDARALVIKKPRSAVAWGRLGMVLLAHNLDEAAAECFASAFELDPQNHRWPYFAGICASISNPEEAIARFDQAAELAPDDPWTRFRYAELLMDIQRLDEAEAVLSSVQSAGQARRMLFDVVRLAVLRNDLATLKSFSKEELQTLSSGPNSRSGVELLAQVWHRLGRQQDADAASRQARGMSAIGQGWDDPYVAEVFSLRKDPVWRAEAARRTLAEGNAEEAIRQLEELVAEYPDDPQWTLELAHAWTKSGKPDRALPLLLAAAKVHSTSAELNFELGNLQYQLQHWSDAAAAYGSAVRLKPDHSLAFYNLGQSYLKLQQTADAMAAFRNALRCQPDLVAAHVSLAELLAATGKSPDADEARKLLQRAIQIAPENSHATKLLHRLQQP